jgi:hypothetical protein
MTILQPDVERDRRGRADQSASFNFDLDSEAGHAQYAQPLTLPHWSGAVRAPDLPMQPHHACVLEVFQCGGSLLQ